MRKTYKEVITEANQREKFREFSKLCKESREREIIKLKEQGVKDIILVDFLGYPVFKWKKISTNQFEISCDDKFDVRSFNPTKDKIFNFLPNGIKYRQEMRE